VSSVEVDTLAVRVVDIEASDHSAPVVVGELTTLVGVAEVHVEEAITVLVKRKGRPSAVKGRIDVVGCVGVKIA